MGIAGLLPQLRSITKRAHVSKYRGQTVAVDAYCLLHRGSYGCARELVEGEPTARHVHYCMGRVDLLVSSGIKPLIVFDGGRLPNKAEEERARLRSREEAKARARALWAQGNRAAAMECYQRAVDIQPAHAKQFVEALKRRNIPFIVAPYEADAQMAYLALNGLVDTVLTEDSDLLCYGCPTVFFKMDKTGEGEEVRLADLPETKELALQGFGHDLFQEMCVLAGCDFADSLPGIGIKKAHQHLRRTRCFLKVVRALRFDGTKIPEGYERRVQRALWTFQHQRVYCPRRRAVVHLHEIAGGDLAAGSRVPAAAQLVDDEPDFLGPALPDDVAHAIAVGDLDPITKLPFGNELQPCTAPLAGDGAASGCSVASQQPAPSVRLQGGGRRSGLSAAANGGNTLANYKGFLRAPANPAGPAAAADFKPPRSGSAQPGSQDSQQQQQKQQQQQQQQEQHRQQEQQQGSEGAGDEEVNSPRAAAKPPTGGDTLASPTEEQWERFRQQRRQRVGSGPAAAAAEGKPPGPSTSSYFVPAPPAVAGVRRPTTASGGLLARLRAALQPEPSIDELLSVQEADPPATASSDSEEANLEEQPQAPPQQGGGRPRFAVPHRQQQQQRGLGLRGLGPLDLGLRSSPTIGDLLDGDAGMAAAAGGEEEGSQQLPSLACSPADQRRPSQRLWLPQRAAPSQQQQQNEQPLFDIISPAGQQQQQQGQQQQGQQQQQEGGITPGFYVGSGSEAGTDARRLTSVQRRRPAATPSSSSPPADRGSSPSGGDPIASLSHIPAFEGAAEAAMERAAQVAAASASKKMLRPLPPPRHLQCAAASPHSGERLMLSVKRPLLAENLRAENRLLGAAPGGSKRVKGAKPAAAASNLFAAFAFPGTKR